MRILYVGCGHPPDHTTMHPVAYTHELSKLFFTRGHKTALFAGSSLQVTGGQPYSVFRRNFDGVEVYGVSNRDQFNGMDPTRDLSHPECERAFRQAVEHFDPDIVHFQSLKGLSSSLMPVARSMGKSVVVSMHDYRQICPRSHLLDDANEACSGPEDGRRCAECIAGERADKSLEAAYAKRRRSALEWINDADIIVAPSATSADIFTDQGVRPEKITVVAPASGIAERLWDRQTNNNARPDGVLTFGFLGTVARRNAPHLLVDAVRLLRDLNDKYRVSIHGQIEDEGYRREIESRIRDLGQRVPEIEFAGMYSQDVIDELFAEVDVYVAPQIWNNPMSRSMIEALGAGVPVVASIVGNVAEVIGHGYNGLVFEPGNYIDLAAQMRQLIQNPIMVASMRANINSPRPMSWHADKIMDAYESVVSRATKLVPAERKAA